MKTEKFARKPFLIDAVRVTSLNMAEVAEWCGGEVRTDKRENRTVKYIYVPVVEARNERQKKAFIGDWVLFGGKIFRCYTHKAFEDSFEKPSADDKVSIHIHPQLPFDRPDVEAMQALAKKHAPGQV